MSSSELFGIVAVLTIFLGSPFSSEPDKMVYPILFYLFGIMITLLICKLECRPRETKPVQLAPAEN